MVTTSDLERATQHAAPRRTRNAGVPYFQEAGVVALAATHVETGTLGPFLDGFDPSLEFGGYVEDPHHNVTDCDLLPKIAGQVCYLSFGPNRTKHAQAEQYLSHILSSGHHSVLEHSSVTFLFYGVSRSLTHELVRHRVGMSYSQVSQRYCGGKTLRFVERPEDQADALFHDRFEAYIERVVEDYDTRTERLLAAQFKAGGILSGESDTEARKKVRGAARSILPNCVEAPIVVTGNLRAWRHFLHMRATQAAELEIRALAMKVYTAMGSLAPLAFQDFTALPLPDGTACLQSAYGV